MVILIEDFRGQVLCGVIDRVYVYEINSGRI